MTTVSRIDEKNATGEAGQVSRGRPGDMVHFQVNRVAEHYLKGP